MEDSNVKNLVAKYTLDTIINYLKINIISLEQDLEDIDKTLDLKDLKKKEKKLLESEEMFIHGQISMSEILINYINNNIFNCSDVYNLVNAAIKDNPSLLIKDGNVIADGYDAKLDNFRNIYTNTNEILLNSTNSLFI